MKKELFYKILNSSPDIHFKENEKISKEDLNLSKEEKELLLNLIFHSPKMVLINIWKMNLSSNNKVNNLDLNQFTLNSLYDFLFSSKKDFLFSLKIYLNHLKIENDIKYLRNLVKNEK